MWLSAQNQLLNPVKWPKLCIVLLLRVRRPRVRRHPELQWLCVGAQCDEANGAEGGDNDGGQENPVGRLRHAHAQPTEEWRQYCLHK